MSKTEKMRTDRCVLGSSCMSRGTPPDPGAGAPSGWKEQQPSQLGMQPRSRALWEVWSWHSAAVADNIDSHVRMVEKKKIGWVCIQKSKPLGSHHVSRSPSTANILRQLRHTCVWLGLVNGCFSSLLPATERVRGLLTVQFKVWFSQPERFHFSPYSDSEQRWLFKI